MIEVVIPAHDAAPFLRETLDSLAAQTRPPARVIVVNDRSRDASRAVAEAAARDLASRLAILVVDSAGAPGPGPARNTGMRLATQPFVVLHDADDLALPDHHATLAALLVANPDAVLGFGDLRRFRHGTGAALSASNHAERGLDALPARGLPGGAWDAGEALLPLLVESGIVYPSQAMLRREAALAIGLHDEARRFAEDYDFLLRLALAGPFLFSRTLVTARREHEDSYSGPRFAHHYMPGIVDTLATLRARAMPAAMRAALQARLDWLVPGYLEQASQQGLGAYRHAAAMARAAGHGALVGPTRRLHVKRLWRAARRGVRGPRA